MVLSAEEKIMKKNLFFFGILSALLMFTYFYEELGQSKKKLLEESENRLFDVHKLGAMLRFSTMNQNEIVYLNNNFYTKKLNYPVSPSGIKLFFDILSSIKINRYLTKNEVNDKNIDLFIPDLNRKITFEFEKGKIEFILGKKIQTDPSFYILVKTEVDEFVVVAYDDSALEGIYVEENVHQNSEKYNRLIRAFNMTEEDFVDRKILKYLDLETISKGLTEIKIENLRNISFSIFSHNQTTYPEILKGLRFNEEYYLFFLGALINMQAQNIWLPEKGVGVKDQIAHMILMVDKKIDLKLFRQYGHRTGFFVQTSLEKVIFEIDQNSVRLFFSNVQDFWDKRVMPESYMKLNKQFDFSIIFNREYVFKIDNSSKFNVISEDPNNKPKNSGFKELLDFLQREADFVKKRLKHNNKEILFSFTFYSSTFHVIFKEGDLIIADTQNDLEFHYHLGDLSRFKHVKSDFLND
ncbi:MAG: hypothetical protein A2381_19725 [Bdellovibrionales bacterium RIFOXYB1_FULL_37_110]|nr:MAG: hypothetical protein A2181_06610 [Bdellovibrionales bacterium RIFOXYA1_FULL_38_20]OFZ61012.1 MAG: hypothetical protein A2381_19725 [Bdellovibrionales bacterium RIFOXYB1_FULL_37_110]OFZ63463.1 MAG: hypothetical protein A2577_06245 [Bdellovibrionales bacterium RIFOXYD1_FULL_36_51]